MKQTFDTEAKINLTSDGKIDDTGVNLVVNPYCEFAVEEGIRIKEKLGSGEVTVLSVGTEKAETAIRQCLAMGADKGALVNIGDLDLDEPSTALILSKAIEKFEYDIILAGFQAVDDGSAQVGPRFAQLAGLPHVTVVTKIDLEGGKAVATREIDDGVEIIEVPLPAVFTAQQGLAEPRYPSMKGIMQAKKKPLDRFSLEDIGLDKDIVQEAIKTSIVKYSLPDARKGGRIIDGEPAEAATKVVQLLRSEAKVI